MIFSLPATLRRAFAAAVRCGATGVGPACVRAPDRRAAANARERSRRSRRAKEEGGQRPPSVNGPMHRPRAFALVL